MGQNATKRTAQGAGAGLAVPFLAAGVATYAVTGRMLAEGDEEEQEPVEAQALFAEPAESLSERENRRLAISGTAGAMATVTVGLKAAAFMGGVGFIHGTVEDAVAGVVELQRELTEASDSRDRQQRRRSADVAKSNEPPSEATPLLYALVTAQLKGALTKLEAFSRAASFVAASADAESRDDIQTRAERAAREVLIYVMLYESCSSKKDEIQLVAAQLAVCERRHVIDAALFFCSTEPMHLWSDELARFQNVREISAELLAKSLQLKYQEVKTPLIRGLRRHFPGGPLHEYGLVLDRYHQELSAVAFWKAHALLIGEKPLPALKGLTFADLKSMKLLEVARARLDRSFLSRPKRRLMRSLRSNDPATDAALRASTPLALVSAPNEFAELQVDVVEVAHVGGADYRIGDWARSFLPGSDTLRAYIEVAYDAELMVTDVMDVFPDSDRAQEAQGQVSAASFNSTFRFRLSKNGSLKMQFAMYDSRPMHGMMFGDPLIGKGEIDLSVAEKPEESQCHAVPLRREDAENSCYGVLTVRTRLLLPGAPMRTAGEMFCGSQGAAVVEVLQVLAETLSQSQGAQMLFNSLPECLLEHRQFKKIEFRRLLGSWVARLHIEVETLRNGASKEAMFRHIGRTLKSAEQIIAMSAPADIDGNIIHELTAQWVWNAFSRCAGTGGVPDALGQEKLLGLLKELWPPVGDPKWELDDMGVNLPLWTSANVVSAVATRLREAHSTQEDEIFTGSPIIVDGRVSPGLAAVVRTGQGSSATPYIFIYNLESIRRWQREAGSDPNTREPLATENILPL